MVDFHRSLKAWKGKSTKNYLTWKQKSNWRISQDQAYLKRIMYLFGWLATHQRHFWDRCSCFCHKVHWLHWNQDLHSDTAHLISLLKNALFRDIIHEWKANCLSYWFIIIICWLTNERFKIFEFFRSFLLWCLLFLLLLSCSHHFYLRDLLCEFMCICVIVLSFCTFFGFKKSKLKNILMNRLQKSRMGRKI